VTFLFDHDVPDDMAFGLTAMGHEVFRLRELLDPRTTDEHVLRFAADHDYILITCNRDDFLTISQATPHVGIIILIRRNAYSRTRSVVASSGARGRGRNSQQHQLCLAR